MCLTLSKYIFSRSKVLWENHSIKNFLSQKSCISSHFTPRPNKSSEATSKQELRGKAFYSFAKQELRGTTFFYHHFFSFNFFEVLFFTSTYFFSTFFFYLSFVFFSQRGWAVPSGRLFRLNYTLVIFCIKIPSFAIPCRVFYNSH